MKGSELEAGMLKLLENVDLDAYERSNAEQDVRRAAYIVELASHTGGMINRGGRCIGSTALSVWRGLTGVQAKT